MTIEKFNKLREIYGFSDEPKPIPKGLCRIEDPNCESCQ